MTVYPGAELPGGIVTVSPATGYVLSALCVLASYHGDVDVPEGTDQSPLRCAIQVAIVLNFLHYFKMPQMY